MLMHHANSHQNLLIIIMQIAISALNHKFNFMRYLEIVAIKNQLHEIRIKILCLLVYVCQGWTIICYPIPYVLYFKQNNQSCLQLFSLLFILKSL